MTEIRRIEEDFFCLIVVVVPGICESRPFGMPGKHSTAELYPLHYLGWFFKKHKI
jgi:hypothetical protein